jgi:hypothetical protein
MEAPDIANFPNLITNVSHTNLDKWTEDILKKFNFEDDKSDIINTILTLVKQQDVDLGDPNASILNLFKDMQRRYVHVSLFASLSYIYITEILTSQQQIIQEYIQTNTMNIATLQEKLQESQQSAATVESLKKEIATLTAQTESFKTLESDLQTRAKDLSGFVSGYATAVGAAPAPAPGGGGSKKKKRAQKGGFVRDGTRANLAGDPYPKAS